MLYTSNSSHQFSKNSIESELHQEEEENKNMGIQHDNIVLLSYVSVPLWLNSYKHVSNGATWEIMAPCFSSDSSLVDPFSVSCQFTFFHGI